MRHPGIGLRQLAVSKPQPVEEHPPIACIDIRPSSGSESVQARFRFTFHQTIRGGNASEPRQLVEFMFRPEGAMQDVGKRGRHHLAHVPFRIGCLAGRVPLLCTRGCPQGCRSSLRLHRQSKGTMENLASPAARSMSAAILRSSGFRF